MRPTVLSLSLSLASLLLASCGSSNPSPAKAGPGGGAVITISPAKATDYDTWIFDDHGSLPAIADDGSAVAALFHDSVDFVGSPVDTLVVWSTADGKELARVRIAGDSPDAPVPDDRATALAAEATKALAGHRWLPATGSAVAEDRDDGASVVRLGGDRLIRLTPEGTLVMEGARLVPDTFPDPGTMSEDMTGESGGCGEITGLDVIAGGRAKDDWIVLAPKVNLGGDSCFGELGADLARFIRISK